MKDKYYSLKNIDSREALYNIIIGERSNGKTYACLYRGIEQYVKNGSQMAYIRRWQDDFTGKRGATIFDGLCNNDVIRELTDGEWWDVFYYSSRWYLCRYDESGKRIVKEEPFAYGFSISSMEHDKSTSYPRIKTIVFDEFITHTAYLPDEFVLFCNTLSTIIRDRNDVKIYMCGNTVSKYCPYFKELGLTHIKDMKQGTIDVYTYGDSGLRVAVEYCATNKDGKPSDVYFAFNNPKLAMVTSGGWQLDIYPHCPVKYAPKDIVFTYFIEYEGELLQCEIVRVDNTDFTFIHRKTTDIKDLDNDFIVSPTCDPRPNHKRRLTKPITKLEKRIYSYFINDKVFYQDNEIGEIVRGYLNWCNTQ